MAKLPAKRWQRCERIASALHLYSLCLPLWETICNLLLIMGDKNRVNVDRNRGFSWRFNRKSRTKLRVASSQNRALTGDAENST